MAKFLMKPKNNPGPAPQPKTRQQPAPVAPQMPQLDDWLNDWEKNDWLGEHGELAVDVFQNDNEIVIKSALAGVKPQDIDISVNHDVLTLRGKRHQEEKIDKKDYLFQECYWGGFSRTIVLPSEVAGDKVKATLKNGILTVTLPKIKTSKTIKVEEIEEF